MQWLTVCLLTRLSMLLRPSVRRFTRGCSSGWSSASTSLWIVQSARVLHSLASSTLQVSKSFRQVLPSLSLSLSPCVSVSPSICVCVSISLTLILKSFTGLWTRPFIYNAWFSVRHMMNFVYLIVVINTRWYLDQTFQNCYLLLWFVVMIWLSACQ